MCATEMVSGAHEGKLSLSPWLQAAFLSEDVRETHGLGRGPRCFVFLSVHM